MRGRRKIQNPKSELVRITLRARKELVEIRRILQMPAYYKEGDVIEALIHIIKIRKT